MTKTKFIPYPVTLRVNRKNINADGTLGVVTIRHSESEYERELSLTWAQAKSLAEEILRRIA